MLERRRGSDYNNLPLKAAMCRRFKVEDGTELESQTLKGEKGRKRERWRECESNVSVCLHFGPLLKAVLIKRATDSKTGRNEETAQIFYR